MAEAVFYAAAHDLEDDWNDVRNWLNTNLTTDASVAKLNKDYSKYGIVTIDNFLFNDKAEEMYWFLSERMTDNNWVSSFMFDFSDNSIDLLKGHPKNSVKLQQLREKCIQSYFRDESSDFAFIFDRTHSESVYHSTNCDCYLCFFENIFLSSEYFTQWLFNITGTNLSLKTMFASRYNEGDFLARHSDHMDTRQLAYVIQFTKGWKPEYGGLLMIQNAQDYNLIEKVIVPKFNSITIFNVSTHNNPHFVSQVATGVKKKRLAIAGWFQFSSSHQPKATETRQTGNNYARQEL